MEGCNSHLLTVDTEYCPHAITDWLNYYKRDSGSVKDQAITCAEVKEKARRHLSALGWVFWHAEKAGKAELRYTSPTGKCYYSLRTACRAAYDHECQKRRQGTKTDDLVCVDEEPNKTAKRRKRDIPVDENNLGSVEHLPLVEPVHPEFQEKGFPSHVESSACSVQQTTREVVVVDHDTKGLGHEKQISWHDEPSNCIRRPKKKRGKPQKIVDKVCKPRYRQTRSAKRARDKVTISKGKPNNILSWLIENNVVLPRAEVLYYDRERDIFVKEGVITCYGIECDCCQKIFSVSQFEVHAGCTSPRATANTLLLDDGRSLLDCQMHLMREYQNKNAAEDPDGNRKGEFNPVVNDEICSVCHCGGVLVLCDQCPSSFHMQCIGLKHITDGNWFCPSCCCKICGMNLPEELENSTLNSGYRRCQQCRIKFHLSCIHGGVTQSTKSLHTWFCSRECEKVNWGLKKIIENPVSIRRNNLQLSLLKPVEVKQHNLEAYDIGESAENFTRLMLALEVMNECFETIIDPFTKGDIIENVIFNKESKLNRVNFPGFYTVTIESNGEMIAAAFVRIHGKKLAEIPLIGTRFQYRGQGMCRIIINELERLLGRLGVEMLVLPAVPSMLKTWTNSFRFSKMADNERSQLVHHTFLEFESTILCHKLLRPI